MHCSWQSSPQKYFCCFPLALANISPWPQHALLSNFFEQLWTQNQPQYLSALSLALFLTTFLEIVAYLDASPLSIYPSLFTSPSEDSCILFVTKSLTLIFLYRISPHQLLSWEPGTGHCHVNSHIQQRQKHTIQPYLFNFLVKDWLFGKHAF